MRDIEDVKKEYEELLNQLSDPELISNWDKFEELTKKKNFFEKIIQKENELKDAKNKLEENKSILASQEDRELVSLAETETDQLLKREGELEKELKKLIETGPEEEIQEQEISRKGAVIVEIRAGTGGEEASLFVADLYKMYSKYGQLQGWKHNVLDSSASELGGFKEIVFELDGSDVFSKMQHEGGVHRVQRIPETEKQGRIHTSTASVAVLPKPKETEIKISPSDIRVEVYKSSGPGGQYVNKRMTAVRIIHLATGLTITSQTERNLHQNKNNAMGILAAKLLEKKTTDEENKMGSKRKTQIGKAQRAEKIRTYNFPQDRITDHRIKKSFHHIEAIMEGELDPIVNSLQSL